MAQRNDQVFQLSLTEIAFTVAFLLLLLLGYLVYKEQSARETAEAALSQVQSAERATTALNAATSALSTKLGENGFANPDEVISQLIAAEQVRTERDQLRQRVDDLDAKLTALTELKERLEQVASSSRQDIMQEEVLSALALQEQVRAAVEQAAKDIPRKPDADSSNPAEERSAPSPESPRKIGTADSKAAKDKEALEVVRRALATTAELRKQLKEKLSRELLAGGEAQAIEEVVTAAKSFGDLAKSGQDPESLRKESSDLRDQVAF